jgi:hypothetical protein
MAVRAIRIVSSLEGRRFNDESVKAFHQRSRCVALITGTPKLNTCCSELGPHPRELAKARPFMNG